MRNKQKQIKKISALAFLIIFLVNFQNCSQPGSINVTSSDSTNNVFDAETPASTPPAPTTPNPAGPTVKDLTKLFTVNPSSGKVDVLVVIDNSGSMNYEQKNMAQRFDSFIDKLQGLDWQIGIVTTDLSTDALHAERKDGRLLKFSTLNKFYISSQDDLALAKAAFANVIQRPASEGSGLEQGIKATYRALERTLSTANSQGTDLEISNFGFIRQDASLSVIVVTDADETATQVLSGYDKQGKAVYKQLAGDESTFSPQNFPLNLFEFVKNSYVNKVFKFNSIIVKPDDVVCRDNAAPYLNNSNVMVKNDNETFGLHYKQMSDLTGGIIGDVCAADYDEQLKVIGQNTVDQINEILLDCNPTQLQITNTTQQLVLSNYTVTQNKVTFSEYLPVASYQVNYSCQIQ